MLILLSTRIQLVVCVVTTWNIRQASIFSKQCNWRSIGKQLGDQVNSNAYNSADKNIH